jgi:hypothetical protein
MARPPVIGNRAQRWRPNTGQDPARYLVDPASLYHAPARFRVGSAIFIFPATEGFERTGQAQLGIHHYLGDDFPVVQVTHRGDRRITLNGTFPGRSSTDMRNDLEVLLNAPSPVEGKKLLVPGVFVNEQLVEVESYSFRHTADDQTHSIDYDISFVLTSIGRKISDPHGKPEPPNPTPSTKSKSKGKSVTTLKTRGGGGGNIHSAAFMAYNDGDKAALIVAKNADSVDDRPLYQLVTKQLPYGTELRY